MASANTSSEKKSGGFSLKSLFIKEEIPAQAPQKAEAPVQAAPEYHAPAGRYSTLTASQSGTVDPAIRDTLQKAMEDKKLDGFDYFKFKQSREAMAAIAAGEKAQFQGAFVAAQSLSVTKEKLISTAEHYLQVLDGELKEFNEAIDTQVHNEIGTGEAEVARMESDIAQRNAAIAQASDEINALQKEKLAKSGELSEQKAKIDVTKRNFTTTHNVMAQDIKNDIEKINTYL